MTIEGRVSGIDLIAAERERQIAAEGWSIEHDDEHEYDEMAQAAACYATPPRLRKNARVVVPGSTRSPSTTVKCVKGWPWDAEWWKPTPDNRIRELVKAGALIAAEIDRLSRMKEKA